MDLRHGISEYGAKIELLEQLASGRQVLHLGAVGETGSSVESGTGPFTPILPRFAHAGGRALRRHRHQS